MATARKPKALIEAEKKIAELEKKLQSESNTKDLWYKSYNEAKVTLDGLHCIIDDLGVRRYKDDDKYNELPMAVRLFSWEMMMSSKGVK